MKKTMAIVLALVVVLCATAALAGTQFVPNKDGVSHKYIYDTKNPESATDMACVFETLRTTTETIVNPSNQTDSAVAANEVHEVKTIVTEYGVCRDCRFEMEPKVTTTVKLVAHTLVRGAYIGSDEWDEGIAHNDATHLIGYDYYQAVCSVCGDLVVDAQPIYKAHSFQTKAPSYYKKDGTAVYGKGNYCKYCNYVRAYKELTTAAGKKVEAIIAAYEAAGLTVEFDQDQMIAVGIEEGEVAEVEGCGVAVIQFTNWTPVDKFDTNQVVTDNVAIPTKYVYTSNGKSSKKAADAWGVDLETGKAKLTEAGDIPFCTTTKVVPGTVKDININQDRCYEAAYVTMYVDGAAHRVYFYNRHDKNGWVYAFEADMAEETVKVKGFSANTGTQVYNNKARAARCGAGQEYASVGAYFIGTELDIIGHAYATEGYDTTTDWIMVGDFEFVSNGKLEK